MRRIVIITATLLVSTLGAQAASQQAPYNNRTGIGGLPTANMPPGFRAVFEDAVNAIQRGSVHPRAHDSACLARQRKLADDIQGLVGGSAMVQRNPTMMELRTRCMPVNPNPPDYW